MEFDKPVSFWKQSRYHLFMLFFAKNITYLKNRQKVDTQQIAANLGATFPYLASGDVSPTVQDLIVLSSLFNVSIDDLLKKDLEARANLAQSKIIKFLVLDVDGTLTDGGMIFTSNGDEMKRFDAKDGRGIINTIKAGIPVGLLSSGLNQPLLEKRAKMLGIQFVFADEKSKLVTLSKWCNQLNISLENVAYIGDDVNDVKVMQHVGIAACPSDAVREVRDIAHVILTKKGGHGCVREFIDEYIFAETEMRI